MADFRSLIQRSGKDSRISLGVGSSRPITDPNTGGGGGGNGRPPNPGKGGGGGPKGGPNSDPFFSSVVLLCHCDDPDGTTGATTTVNVSGRSLNRSASATITTSQFKFGTASMNQTGGFDSFGFSAADSAFAYGTGAFTIEFWLRPTAVTPAHIFFDQRTTGNGFFPTIYHDASGAIIYMTNNIDRITSAASALTANVFQFVAYSKQAGSGGLGELSVNGTVVGSWADNITYVDAALYIGGISTFASPIGQPGQVDEIRITKGVARYSGSFAAPTAAFPNNG